MCRVLNFKGYNGDGPNVDNLFIFNFFFLLTLSVSSSSQKNSIVNYLVKILSCNKFGSFIGPNLKYLFLPLSFQRQSLWKCTTFWPENENHILFYHNIFKKSPIKHVQQEIADRILLITDDMCSHDSAALRHPLEAVLCYLTFCVNSRFSQTGVCRHNHNSEKPDLGGVPQKFLHFLK